MNTRPHRFPQSAIGEDVLAWVCQACGEVVREYGSREQTECPVDWRKDATPHRALCPTCQHSIRLGDDGRLVDHADPRFGAVGLCPGSGRGNVGVMEMPTW